MNHDCNPSCGLILDGLFTNWNWGGGGGLNRGFTFILSTASIILFLELLPGNEWGRGCGNQPKL